MERTGTMKMKRFILLYEQRKKKLKKLKGRDYLIKRLLTQQLFSFFFHRIQN